MINVRITPDQVDDIIDYVLELRDRYNMSFTHTITPSHDALGIYNGIVEYVERYEDIVLTTDKKSLFFKAVKREKSL